MKITFYAKISREGESFLIRIPRSLTPMFEDLYKKEVRVTVWAGENHG